VLVVKLSNDLLSKRFFKSFTEMAGFSSLDSWVKITWIRVNKKYKIYMYKRSNTGFQTDASKKQETIFQFRNTNH